MPNSWNNHVAKNVGQGAGGLAIYWTCKPVLALPVSALIMLIRSWWSLIVSLTLFLSRPGPELWATTVFLLGAWKIVNWVSWKASTIIFKQTTHSAPWKRLSRVVHSRCECLCAKCTQICEVPKIESDARYRLVMYSLSWYKRLPDILRSHWKRRVRRWVGRMRELSSKWREYKLLREEASEIFCLFTGGSGVACHGSGC